MTYRVAIVGAGIGAQHLDGFLELPEQFEVSLICDLDTERAGTLSKRANCSHTTKLSDVLANEVDIVDICLPPNLHHEACIQALDAGKHVICEKPLVSTLAEADSLKNKSRETCKQVFPVFQYRYGLGTSQYHALNTAGLIGKPHVASLETHWNRGADYYAIDWRGTWAGENGGAILGHAIHIHDLLTALLGPVERVYAELATRINPIEVEDCAALSIRLASGALVTSSVTLGAAKDKSRLRIVTDNMTIESDHAPYAPAAKSWNFTARAPLMQSAIDAVLEHVSGPRIGYAGLFEAIAGVLDGHSLQAVTLDDGCRSLDFVGAVYHSARTGQPVNLPLGNEHPLYEGWLP